LDRRAGGFGKRWPCLSTTPRRRSCRTPRSSSPMACARWTRA